ncbi:hypothetical protein DF16_pBMB8513orf00005 (plasmid) [Bacillus thuringiensis serovar kurstaki str. YBT-1520]|nr:hypothetical protein DF16_pBMB8513orf00005 [Bacillus thuringiensis serovar kurstaki str. YBT-1520]
MYSFSPYVSRVCKKKDLLFQADRFIIFSVELKIINTTRGASPKKGFVHPFLYRI